MVEILLCAQNDVSMGLGGCSGAARLSCEWERGLGKSGGRATALQEFSAGTFLATTVILVGVRSKPVPFAVKQNAKSAAPGKATATAKAKATTTAKAARLKPAATDANTVAGRRR